MGNPAPPQTADSARPPIRGPHAGRERSEGISRSRGAAGRLLALLVLATGGFGAACICPPRAEELADAGYGSPRQTFASFQAYMRADLLFHEYRCLSTGFTRRNGLSALSYAEGREQLFSKKPWLKLFVRAVVVAERPAEGGSRGERGHELDVSVLGRTFRVKLVREEIFEIWAGEILLKDGYGSLEDLSRLRQDTLLIALPAGDLSDTGQITRVLVEGQWKIDDLFEFDPDEDPAAEPEP